MARSIVTEPDRKCATCKALHHEEGNYCARHKPEAAKVCMVEGCVCKVKFRGLCEGCYKTAHRLVKEGKTTWEKLEAARKCLPVVRGGRVARMRLNWFLGDAGHGP